MLSGSALAELMLSRFAALQTYEPQVSLFVTNEFPLRRRVLVVDLYSGISLSCPADRIDFGVPDEPQIVCAAWCEPAAAWLATTPPQACKKEQNAQ